MAEVRSRHLFYTSAPGGEQVNHREGRAGDQLARAFSCQQVDFAAYVALGDNPLSTAQKHEGNVLGGTFLPHLSHLGYSSLLRSRREGYPSAHQC